MCGIAAFSGVKDITPQQAKIAQQKLKILGLYNEVRGSHGCGLYMNGTIYKGWEDTVNKKNTKLFGDFISDEHWIMPELNLEKGSTVILHTRQATRGSQTKENNHPFHILNDDPKRELIGVHNGTIENIWKMCQKHKVDYVKMPVDSQALYALISTVGLSVLEEYEGYAALIYTKPAEPNSLYVFHGCSRKVNKGELYEERPMYYLRCAEGLYFSSMECSLLAIRENLKQKVECLTYNRVFKVTHGKFTQFRKDINRENANLKYIAPATTVTPTATPPRDFAPVQQGRIGFKTGGTDPDDYRSLDQTAGNGIKIPSESHIWHEPLPFRSQKGKGLIYFHKGRYYIAGPALASGCLYITNKGRIGEDRAYDCKPFWFWQGVLLNGESAYNKIFDESKIDNSWVMSMESNFAQHISKYAKYPVTNLESEGTIHEPRIRFAWYSNEKRMGYTKVSPKWSSRCYEIEDGYLKSISSSDEDDKKCLVVEKKAENDLPFDFGNIPAATSVVDVNAIRKQILSADGKKIEGQSFDMRFKDINDCMKSISKLEMQTLLDYATEKMKSESALNPDETEIEAWLWGKIKDGFKAGHTIRVAVEDPQNILDMFLAMNASTTPGKQQAIVDAQASLEDNFVEEGKPEMIDVAAEADMRQTDTEEEENDNEFVIDEDEVVQEICDSVSLLGEVNDSADRLQEVDKSDLAQDACYVIYRGIENIKHGLADVAGNHSKPELLQQINNHLNTKSSI